MRDGGGNRGGMPEWQEDALPASNMFDPPNASDFSDDKQPRGMEAFGDMEPPDDAGTSDRENMTVSGRQPDWGQMRSGGDTLSSNNIPGNTLTLLSISVLTLLIGLFVAIKIKH